MRETNMKRLGRVLSSILPVWIGAFFIFPVFPATVARDADVSKDAWWSFYGQGLPVAAPTTVPADALGVGHNLAQPDKVTAIDISLKATPGSAVQTLALTLKEAEGPGANIGAAQAVVVACPITGPWEPVVNGNWVDVPDYDCTLGKAIGKRAMDGTWAFDLRSFGVQWLDTDYPLEQAGILILIEESTQPAQVSFRAIETGEFRLEFAATAPTAIDEPVEPVIVGGLEPTEAPAPAPAAPLAPPREPAPEVIMTQPTQTQRENITDPDILGNLPWGVWLLVPILIGGAAAVSYALGPGARRGGTARRREGPVSRALSRGSQEGVVS